MTSGPSGTFYGLYHFHRYPKPDHPNGRAGSSVQRQRRQWNCRHTTSDLAAALEDDQSKYTTRTLLRATPYRRWTDFRRWLLLLDTLCSTFPDSSCTYCVRIKPVNLVKLRFIPISACLRCSFVPCSKSLLYCYHVGVLRSSGCAPPIRSYCSVYSVSAQSFAGTLLCSPRMTAF